MAVNYVICEYERVKKNFPEIKAAMDRLEMDMLRKAEADWAPLKNGGMAPKSGQFGQSTIIPALFQDITSTRMTTWYQWFNGTGHQTIMRGANTGGTIYEDYMIGLAGLAFLDKAIRIAEIRMQISDRKLGRINIEEAFAYDYPAIIFEQGYILDEETGFDLYAYVLTQGPQRLMPIGLQLNRIPNKLQVSNTGAALT